MRRRKPTALAMIAALGVVLACGLAACGSTEPDEDGSPTASITPFASPTVGPMTTYHNDEFGFSISYPETYEPVDLAVTIPPEADVSAFLIGFFNLDGSMIGAEPLEGLVVGVSELEEPRTRKEVSQMEKEYRRLLDRQLDALDKVTSTEPLEPAEARVLQHLASTDDPQDVKNCNAVLNTIGTVRALPGIEANLTSRKRDVKASAQWAVDAIRSRSGL